AALFDGGLPRLFGGAREGDEPLAHLTGGINRDRRAAAKHRHTGGVRTRGISHGRTYGYAQGGKAGAGRQKRVPFSHWLVSFTTQGCADYCPGTRQWRINHAVTDVFLQKVRSGR